MFRKKIVIIAIALLGKVYGQVTGDVFVLDRDRDVFYAHYTSDISDNSLFDYQRVSSKLSFSPIGVNKLAFYNTVGVDYHSIQYGIYKPSFLREKERYYNVNYSLLAQYGIAKNWSLNALIMPHLIGSFNDQIKTDGFKINGMLFAEKRFNTKNKNTYYIFSFGVGYLTLAGKTRINPVVNIKGNVNDKISFALGLPSTYVKYDFDTKHAVKLVGDLNDFSVRIENPFLVNQENNMSVLTSVFTTISVGIEYNYWFTKRMGIMVRGTHSVFEKHAFEDATGAYVSGFSVPLKSYLSAGVKINVFR